MDHFISGEAEVKRSVCRDLVNWPVTNLTHLSPSRRLFKEALAKLQTYGATVIDDCDGFNYDSEEYARMDDLVLWTDFKVDLAAYLETLAKCSVHTLADVMQ